MNLTYKAWSAVKTVMGIPLQTSQEKALYIVAAEL